MSIYGGGGGALPVVAAAGTCMDCCCNNTSICDPHSVCFNQTLCTAIASHNINVLTLLQHIIANANGCITACMINPTPTHIAMVLPLFAGGFMLSSNAIRLMRLWARETIWFMKRK